MADAAHGVATVPESPPVPAGLSAGEYAVILARLGRPPNSVEARCFAVMWSEHCAYKHSREVLRRLPTGGAGVLQGPGENAGVVEIGGGWALVWKMESHNHPSAVDPYNGAATGVGGIIRDVLAMGARPIALLDALRLGPLDEGRARRLFAGVVGGIAGYGNSVGVPTVGGDLAVDPTYRDNPLVNVACLGLVRADRVTRGRTGPAGAVLLYAGAPTGRDGIGGAAFASDVLDEHAEREDRAAVQIGDPFAGKCLIEATLDALQTGRVHGIQDMGAGGLACAAAEMAARAGTGVVLDLDRVPRRERNLAPHEVLLSESQERMLMAIPRQEASLLAGIYRRWGLEAEIVGRVTGDGRFRALSEALAVVDLPATLLTRAPARDVTPIPPRPAAAPGAAEVPAQEALLRLMARPEVACKSPVYEQYDHMVQVRTVVPPGRGAAILRLPELAPAGLALTVDGNGRWCAADPYGGAVAAVLEAAANLACVGAEPRATTDCLNFASPEDPEVFWTFVRAVEGIAAACRTLGVPVVGGNVSFYNEGPGGPILPTPVVAMVGLVPDVRRPPAVPADDNLLVLLGSAPAALGGSLYAHELWGAPAPEFPRPDLSSAIRTLACVRDAVQGGLAGFAHDASDGGLATALAEICLLLDSGADVTVTRTDAAALFGEGVGRVICAVSAPALDALRRLADAQAVPLAVLGQLGGRRLRIGDGSGTAVIDLPLKRLRRAWMSLARVVG